jgi:hypothetical protein
VQKLWKKLLPPYSGYNIKQIVPGGSFLSAKLDSVITQEALVIIHNDFHHLGSSTGIIVIKKSRTVRLNEQVKSVMEIKFY